MLRSVLRHRDVDPTAPITNVFIMVGDSLVEPIFMSLTKEESIELDGYLTCSHFQLATTNLWYANFDLAEIRHPNDYPETVEVIREMLGDTEISDIDAKMAASEASPIVQSIRERLRDEPPSFLTAPFRVVDWVSFFDVLDDHDCWDELLPYDYSKHLSWLPLEVRDRLESWGYQILDSEYFSNNDLSDGPPRIREWSSLPTETEGGESLPVALSLGSRSTERHNYSLGTFE